MVQHLCPNSRYNSVYGAYIVATSIPIDPNVKEFLRAEPFHLPKVIRYAIIKCIEYIYMYVYLYIYVYVYVIYIYIYVYK